MYKTHTTTSILKNFKNTNFLVVIGFSILVYLYFRSGVTLEPVENIDIPSGVGIDLIQNNKNSFDYSVPVSYYNYSTGKKISRFVHSGAGKTITETREARQLISSKRATLGLERIFVASEDYSKFGIKGLVSSLFKNPVINDTSLFTVCKGKAEEILSFNVPEYPSSADYIEGVLELSTTYNFFSDNYKVIDLFVRLDSEGRNAVIPYIEIKNEKPQITGMALFKKDIMIKKIDMDEAKTLNMLREKNVTGMLVIQENPKEYTSYYGKTKRKVRCEKKEDEYTFFIDLSLTGEIIENELFPDMRTNKKIMKEFEEKLSKQVEKNSYDFIDKMQKDYKVDCLELGRVAAATFGRHTNVDWDEIVSKSNIKVNVNVKVIRMGRGKY